MKGSAKIKQRSVAVVLETGNPYQRKMIRGVADYANSTCGWSLYVEEDPLDKLPDLRTWSGHGIITTFTEQRFAETIRGLPIPIVGVEGGYHWYEEESGIPYFSTDNEAVARMAAEHLLGCGYPALAYCGLPRNRSTMWSAQRAEALKLIAAEAGVPFHSHVGRHTSPRQWAELQEKVCRWLRSLKKPVGVLAANDARARHVLEACRTIGARVPEDVAVIGVDNDELMCELANPPLSSIEQGAWNIGFMAAERLDRMMDGKKPGCLANLVPPERVIARRSTDYLAVGDASVTAAIAFIREHACERIGVADVLRAVHVSRSTLEARFRKFLHKTIHDEIQQTMLARAQRLLIESDLPLKQIAEEAGFSHAQHLSRVFRQRLGRTPGEFRQSVRHRLH
ncbi:MAG: substrate-binding domain-containing protein [Rhodothermales bacterium]